MYSEEKLYQIALSMVEGIGGVLAKNLLSYMGSAQEVFTAPKSKLLKVPKIGERLSQAIFAKPYLKMAETEIKALEEVDAQILFITDTKYPKRLKQSIDAPIILYYKGNANLNNQKAIAIVGTRKATEYGKNFTEKLIQDIAHHNPLIVSGLAYGIDITAHRAALTNQLDTIGVMANGLNLVYPATHQKTATQMTLQGGLITENTFNTKPDAMRFPARNRIIAGMADAILVMEAQKTGGALITAEIANSYNKEVFALPGDINRPASEGCNGLIQKHKAIILTKAKDLEEMLNWDLQSGNATLQNKIYFKDLPLTDVEKKILLHIKKQSEKIIRIDELSYKTNIEPAKLSAFLLNLEIQGWVKTLPGKQYTLQKDFELA